MPDSLASVLPILQLPRAVPLQKDRPPKENIPQTVGQRERLRAQLRSFVKSRGIVPPIALEELRQYSEEFVREHHWPAIYTDYAGVLLNSELWRDALAAVPFNRRLLLLPKCLRIEERCPAPFDDFGLLCKQCGLCSIQELQEEAERLGYAVLVAEGSALVMAIIETGKIEAIVGVSCLSVLEKAFPYMEAAAIPGVAIPLLQDDCHDVTVDLDWIWEVIHLTSDDRTHRLDLDQLRKTVQEWFCPEVLDRLLGVPANDAERLARNWLLQNGKRWRPFLTVSLWKALQDDPQAPPTDDVHRVAIAMECFHKASLVHDDIEDADEERYGEPTLHAEHGMPIALNVGDLLLGEGYRLIGECACEPAKIVAMLKIVSAGHRMLCLGQGAELSWMRQPCSLSTAEVLGIFRGKTSSAFEVALQLGAVLGDDASIAPMLTQFSAALGIAYQIRDDLEDLEGEDATDLLARRPTLPLAVLEQRTEVNLTEIGDEELRRLMDEYDVVTRCRVLQESYKEEALRSLAQLKVAGVKGLLRRVVSKIFSLEVKGWCSEFETRNAASGATGA